MTRFRDFAVLLVSCAVLGACSEGPSDRESSTRAQTEPSPGHSENNTRAEILMTNPYGKDVVGEQGTIRGTLEVSDYGCVAVRTTEGQFPVWAFKGSSLSDDGQLVVFPDVGEFSLGDNVTLPGGVRTFNAPSKELLPSGYDTCFSQAERDSERVTAAVVETPVEGFGT